MLSQRRLGTATLALGLVVLTDVLRVFLPSVITIFGQAASTPAELLGAFAVGWFVLALVAPALVARVGSATVGVAAVLVLGAARLSLTAAPGGRAQLWLASAGLLAGLVWLAATAARVAYPVPGLVLGMTASALGHALLGTYDLVWWQRWPAWVASVTVVAALLAAETVSGRVAARPVDDRPSPNRRGWLLVGPALLLGNMVALSPAVAISAMSYWYGEAGTAAPPPFALAPLGAAAPLFLLGALTPWHPRWRALPPVLLVAGALLFGYGPPTLLTVAILAGAAGLGGCLALASGGATPQPTGRSGTGPAYAAVGGMLVFAVAALVYYAAYDLGYPNQWVPAVVAALTGVVAMRGAAASDGHRPPRADRSSELPPWRLAVLAAVVALAAAWLHGPWLVASNRPGPPERVRVVAYNIRMGFGLDGRFDLTALDRMVGRADVVVLSEVDRGWLLNGGHDTLGLLAARLGMPYVFAPAADPLWGDAVLSRWPVQRARTRALPAVGAPTGAQALGVTVDFSAGVRLAVVSTHLQPPPGADPVVQARAVADFATGYADGAPLVVAGDLNTEPGDPAFTAFTDAGLVDALAAARPLPTSPADDPREQIDHVLVSPDLVAADAVAVPGTASDHLPVAVTLTLPDR
ncbi:endonuclease/exonuclease/phosphatase family protein [Verrucosispora sp. WMMA2044]|uniref:endonuclease/exonuclease/phosphatase family protein n=1 Tax=Verrucosispora sp. WMMA2044 TaxID=3016419 RepID=UPI00248CD5F6|nr:endonuclease/exonuclease/phosphatase family protein [Verrucosispora sp. WMMA2044]WBB47172.1 endonuclease/exonuclease/phosphatase family protein [Verrucosispora sp. WMMA2044]